MVSRNDIVETARGWLGTKFHHQGRVKATKAHSGGCDCIGLIVGVTKDLEMDSNIFDPVTNRKLPLYKFDYNNYPKLPDGNMLRNALANCLEEITLDEVNEGDVILFRFEDEPQHVGIVSKYKSGGLGIIHCYASARKVVEHRLDETWLKRVVSSYSFPNISN